MIVPCDCGAKLKVDDAKVPEKGARIRCPRCGAILTARKQTLAPPAGGPAAPPSADAAPAPSGAQVLVAHESEAVRSMIQGILADAGFTVETAAEGVAALKKATELRPWAMVLDVGLPGIYGFELCERLKGDEQTKAIKIILLASAYDAGRYKRSPVSLYGADDYIEKHQIAEMLPLKIRKLMFPEEYGAAAASASPAAGPPPASPPAPEQSAGGAFEFSPESLLREADESPPLRPPTSPEAMREAARSRPGDSRPSMQDGPTIAPESFSLDTSIFEKREDEIPRVDGADPEAVEKAKRFARIIVSDIALYNQESVREGIRNGTFFELLKEDIEEGRRLYEKRVSDSIRKKKDHYQEAFDNFIAAQKKIVR